MFDSVFLALFVQGADCLDSPILGKHTKRLPQPMPLSNVAVVEVSCTIMSSYLEEMEAARRLPSDVASKEARTMTLLAVLIFSKPSEVKRSLPICMSSSLIVL